jgi:hypothetical protein
LGSFEVSILLTCTPTLYGSHDGVKGVLFCGGLRTQIVTRVMKATGSVLRTSGAPWFPWSGLHAAPLFADRCDLKLRKRQSNFAKLWDELPGRDSNGWLLPLLIG